ncbi:nodulation protein NolW [Rhodomicrobium vannielii ATCC 17100]|uniref:secretin N-terminal domain-containing protein n=1 Tax=Rhodomicrobium vannielii TaxID=1069 RepID=UPI001917E224|nr:secretin N-terminal domain-containing protein [Rhodomicrobium vannielii]MBJ7533122.1 nodulation protein NolW [Rhodomicrobium vannielii ATCC 17100]
MRVQTYLRCRLVSVAAVAMTAVWAGPVAIAAEPALPDTPYPYSVVEQDVSVALREFGHNVGIPIETSSKVQGRLRGRLERLTAKQFLANICAAYALDWYYDGYTLYISSADEKTTRFVSLPSSPPEELVKALKILGFSDERYPLRAGPKAGSVIVSGPPRYVSLVEQTAIALPNLENVRIGPAPGPVSQTTIYRGSAAEIVKFSSEAKVGRRQ